MTVRLSNRAERELLTIYAESAAQFGLAQADRYVAGLRSALALLAEQPQLTRERQELISRARAYRYKSHVIVYREEEEEDGILVIRLPHGRSDWINQLD